MVEELHEANIEELHKSWIALKEKTKGLFTYLYVLHILGIMGVVFFVIRENYFAAFVTFILLAPDVDDMANYLKKANKWQFKI